MHIYNGYILLTCIISSTWFAVKKKKRYKLPEIRMLRLQTVIEGFKQPKEVLKQDDNADQNYFIIVINT